MKNQKTFTIHELEELSGFDRRTIAYYIQVKLLPKIGRRGPKTVYPLVFYNKLRFIRVVRDLQDNGKLRAVTLDEIREVMNSLDASAINRLVKTGVDIETIRAMFPTPDWDTRDLALPVERIVENLESNSADTRRKTTKANSQTVGFDEAQSNSDDRHAKDEAHKEATSASSKPVEPPVLSSINQSAELMQILMLLNTIEETCAAEQQTQSDNNSLHTTTVQLTPNITLSANHLPQVAVALLQQLGQRITRLTARG